MTKSQTTTQRPAARAPWTPADLGWRVPVTPDDVRCARDARLSAQDAGAPSDRVQDLREELERLWRAEACQIACEVWRYTARV